MSAASSASSETRRTPLWHGIRDDLLRRIQAGEFASGFPGEKELATSYGVSRTTIRAALAPLRQSGLISAHPGRQSAVVDTAVEHRFGPVYSLFHSVRQTGMTQHSRVLEAEHTQHPPIAERLGLDPEAELVHVRRERRADEDVIAIDDAWLPAELCAPLLDADLSDTALYQALQEHCGISLTSAQETLHAVVTDEEQADALQCAPGTPAFFIERLGMLGERPVEWRQTLMRADLIRVSVSYPSGGLPG